jgi:hypothetical protein
MAARLVAVPRQQAYVRAMRETTIASTSGWSRPLIGVATAIGALLAGTIAMWVHYGTAVFYEMIVAGLAACF